MANNKKVAVSGAIYVLPITANVDSKYGPYQSVEEAWELLGPDEDDVACIGLTVGIQEDPDGPIVEYWFKDACESADDLVPKGAEVPSGTVIDPDYVHTDNNYTDEEKTKLEGLENYDDTEILAVLDDKVDKEDGKALSSNDFTTTEKTKLASVEENAQENIIEEVKVNNTALTPDENKSINIFVPEVLEDLDNISVTDPTDGQVLAYDATNDEWVNETIVVDKALDDLTDVTITSASDRQTLIYDSTNDEWVNGTLNTSDLTNDSGFIDNTVDDLVNYYDKTEIDSKVASVYKYKGSVNAYSDLPSTDQVIGDVYNIATADKTHHIKAGDNVAWNGTEWDILAGEIDLTDYYTSNEVDDLLDEKISEPVTEGTNGQVLTTDGNGGRTWTTVDVDKDLSDLGDVTITDPTDGQILKYDAANNEWINQTLQIHNIQVEELPTASSTEEGNIYQYVGTTTSDYINGHFYKCVSDGESTPTYSWKNIDVIDKSVTYSETIPETSNYEEGDVVVYTGSDTDFFKNGHAYKKIVLQDYKYWNVRVNIDSTGQTFNGAFRRGGQTLDLKPNLILYEINGDFKKHILVREVISETSFKGTYLTSNETYWQKGDTAVFSKIHEPSGGYSKTWEDWEEISTQRVFLPVASADELGNIYQYIGSYDSNYTSGHFYKCVSDGESTPTYSWEEVKYSTVSALDDLTNVDITTPTEGDILIYDSTNSEWVNVPNTDIGQIIQVSILPTASIDELGKIYQYIGATTSTLTNGYFYKCISDGEDPATYSWENIQVQEGTSSSQTLSGLDDVNITNPTNDQILKYDATNDEWVNGEGGAGQIIQVAALPSTAEIGTIYQYIGETSSNYIKGYFYIRSQYNWTPIYTQNTEIKYFTEQSSIPKYFDGICCDYNFEHYLNESVPLHKEPTVDATIDWYVNKKGFGTNTSRNQIIPEDGYIFLVKRSSGDLLYLNSFVFTSSTEFRLDLIYVDSGVESTYRGYIDGTSGDIEGINFKAIQQDELKYYLKNKNQFTKCSEGQTIQVEELPTASIDELDKIYQYIGTTTSTYTNGYFYKCVSDGGDLATYSWENIQVQQGGSGSQTLSGLDDTSIESPKNNQVLSYDKRTDKWVNKLSEAENVVYKKIPGNEWLPKIWTGLTASYGAYIWTDGENIYYSWKNDHYVLDKSTSTWVEKTWIGLTKFYGNSIWSDGNNTYYSNGDNQYILDKSISTWSPKTWTGLTEFWGATIWSDGDNIYYSANSNQYVLDKSTSTWSPKTWIGLSSFNGEGIWSDGNNIYLSNGPIQYTLDKETSTWVEKTWIGLTRFSSTYIWSDSNNIYLSNGNDQYILDKSTSTWVEKTWIGLTEFYGLNIWSDGNNIYHSNGDNQYILDLVNINVKEVIDNIDTKMTNIFTGTQAEWEALSTSEKLTYGQVNITDDESDTNVVVDAVTDGDMHAVTSNAVYDELKKVKSQTYECSGFLINSRGGEITGYGRAIVTLKDGIAEIKFSARIHTNTMTSTFSWGLNRDLLHTLLPNLPNITPVSTNSNLLFFAANGIVLTDLMGYGAMASGEDQFWIPARMYQIDGSTGVWGSDEFPVNSYITGVVYGAYTV